MSERTCSVDGCPGRILARGLCGKHYQRVAKYGTTELPPRRAPGACAAPGCERKAVVRGVCGMHNHRLLTHGTFDDPKPSAEERLKALVAEVPSGCWLYQGSIIPPRGRRKNGYGLFWLNGRTVLAHRASYEIFVGPIPDGLTIDHLCGTPACVNPAHLDAVTQAENNRRRDQAAA